ncbi:hypothetical protein FH5T_13460 [Draconibacterium orientale]|uniref:Uncharacterized protein n=1 Tax=Draconibacterium orientale TaxID=1168034 RepID=A0ABM5QE39_9BACT|nr:hypothetical protein FH5T_13460 [Draconibacterium orientale]
MCLKVPPFFPFSISLAIFIHQNLKLFFSYINSKLITHNFRMSQRKNKSNRKIRIILYSIFAFAMLLLTLWFGLRLFEVL